MIVDIIISLLLVIGGIFGLVGSLGLVKLADPMARLHVPTKATTLGVGSILVASMLFFALVGGVFSFHELLITLFLFITAPISAHFIAKAYLHSYSRADKVPPTGNGAQWGTYGKDAAPEE